MPAQTAIALEAYVGRPFTFDIAVTDSGGDPLDLTGGVLFLDIRGPDDALVLQKRATAFADAQGGLCNIACTAREMPRVPGIHRWLLWFRDTSGIDQPLVLASTINMRTAGTPGEAF